MKVDRSFYKSGSKEFTKMALIVGTRDAYSRSSKSRLLHPNTGRRIFMPRPIQGKS
ncbi:hypothetical protein PSAC2689_100195 [Paraburkholderia sacchari]